MSKKSAAHQNKVDSAVQFLQNTTAVRVLQAMMLARFSKQDTANKTVRRMIQGQHGGGGNKNTGGDSNGRGTDNNQQSTKSGGSNGDRNGNNDSNDNDNEHKGDAG
jgi:hypothetical protein